MDLDAEYRALVNAGHFSECSLSDLTADAGYADLRIIIVHSEGTRRIAWRSLMRHWIEGERKWDAEFCCGCWVCLSRSSFCCGCSSAAERPGLKQQDRRITPSGFAFRRSPICFSHRCFPDVRVSAMSRAALKNNKGKRRGEKQSDDLGPRQFGQCPESAVVRRGARPQLSAHRRRHGVRTQYRAGLSRDESQRPRAHFGGWRFRAVGIQFHHAVFCACPWTRTRRSILPRRNTAPPSIAGWTGRSPPCSRWTGRCSGRWCARRWKSAT